MEHMQLKAMGKLNLGLDVVGRRPDGYHEVRMVMQTVNLYDRIELTAVSEPGISITTNLSFLPTDASNIVYKAADLLIKEFEIQSGLSISLEKHIPVAAGMAGGSTDAAAVLYGMNRMFSLGLSQKQLMERGVKLGADVPYCIVRGTALCEGIGEIVTSLPAIPACSFLIAKPPVSISTKAVYERLDRTTLDFHPDIDGIVTDIQAGDLPAMCGKLGNVLEKVTAKKYPRITEVKDFIKEQGALVSLMTGSGSAVYGIFETEEEAQKGASNLKKSGLVKQVYVARPYQPKHF